MSNQQQQLDSELKIIAELEIGFGAIVLVMMTLVVGLICAPLIWELVLTIFEILGWQTVRIQPKALRTTIFLSRIGNRGEKASVILIVLFISLPIFLHWVEFLPFFLPGASNLYMFVFHVLPSIWLNSNMFFNYYHAVSKNPGRPDMHDGSTHAQQCQKCNSIKAQGTSHCSVCNCCTIGLDHHCIFINNCVGKRNYRNFYMFGFYAWLSTVYALYVAYRPFNLCQKGAGGDDSYFVGLCAAFGLKVRAIAIAFGACISISGFFAFISYAALTDQTILGLIRQKKVRVGDVEGQKRRGMMASLVHRFGPVSSWWRYAIPIDSLHRAIIVEAER